MATLEQRLTRIFLQSLLKTLTNSDLQQVAVENHQTVKIPHCLRYAGKDAFNLHAWSDDDASKFTAAISEGLAAAQSEIVKQEGFGLGYTVYEIGEKIKKELIPQLTDKINCEKPLKALPGRIRLQLSKLPSEEYSSGFFYAAVAVTVGIGATAALLLSSSNQ